MSSFWDTSAKILGWLIVITLVLTILFIIFWTVAAGPFGLFISLIISFYLAVPVLIILGIGYGVSKYNQDEKTFSTSDGSESHQ